MSRLTAFYVGDDRDAVLQRMEFAREIDALIPGFSRVHYSDWGAVLERYWREAPKDSVLVIDELPSLVEASPELPSLLQKAIDREQRAIILCGSSQRMMQGLVLDASAPLYGRAREILHVMPLAPKWILPALQRRDAVQAIHHYATWGGVPRYWELAREYRTHAEAVKELVLSPNGVLHREPERLLLDDTRETARAASILTLIGNGAHRLSEIASRLSMPATSLTRPIARLIDLGLVAKETPFGTHEKTSKRTLYRIADPFLGFWYRFVEPNRSRLGSGQLDLVMADWKRAWPQFLGTAWESMVRVAIAHRPVSGQRWLPARRFWGSSNHRKSTLEIDAVAQAADGSDKLLVAEAKLSLGANELGPSLAALEHKARACFDHRFAIVPVVFVLQLKGTKKNSAVFGPEFVLGDER